jgi:hypothetical protein
VLRAHFHAIGAQFHSDLRGLCSRFLDDGNPHFFLRSAAFVDAWQCHWDNQHSLANPLFESTAILPGWIMRSVRFRSDRAREEPIQALFLDRICLHQVHEQLHCRNDPLSQMKMDFDKAFWDFLMQLRDLEVGVRPIT